jgi:hypothetical protein
VEDVMLKKEGILCNKLEPRPFKTIVVVIMKWKT